MPLSPERLQRLVRHRERLERLQEEKLAEAVQQQQRRREALTEAESRRDAVFAAGTPAGGLLDPASLDATGAYVTRVKREIGARRSALAHSSTAVEAERQKLLERRRERKAIDTLLDRQLELERVERNRADIRRLDEIAAYRWFAGDE